MGNGFVRIETYIWIGIESGLQGEDVTESDETSIDIQ